MTVKEVLASLRELEKQNPEMQVYFDCPYCGKSNTMSRIDRVVLLRQGLPEAQHGK